MQGRNCKLTLKLHVRGKRLEEKPRPSVTALSQIYTQSQFQDVCGRSPMFHPLCSSSIWRTWPEVTVFLRFAVSNIEFYRPAGFHHSLHLQELLEKATGPIVSGHIDEANCFACTQHFLLKHHASDALKNLLSPFTLLPLWSKWKRLEFLFFKLFAVSLKTS